MVLLLLWAALPAGRAHITYSGRNFGTFVGGESPVTISGQTVSSNFGWVDAADGNYGDSHRTRAYRFTLLTPASVTVAFTGATGFFPGFSLFSGLAHVAPSLADHDATAISQAYLAGLGGGPYDGSLNALGNWAIGNDDDTVNSIPASLSYLTYVGYAADGQATSYGSGPALVTDGVADNFVSGTFVLAAGDYSIFVGGQDYSARGPITLGLNSLNGSSYTTFGVTAQLTVLAVPEPATMSLVGIAVVFLGGWRWRRLKLRLQAD